MGGIDSNVFYSIRLIFWEHHKQLLPDCHAKDLVSQSMPLRGGLDIRQLCTVDPTSFCKVVTLLIIKYDHTNKIECNMNQGFRNLSFFNLNYPFKRKIV